MNNGRRTLQLGPCGFLLQTKIHNVKHQKHHFQTFRTSIFWQAELPQPFSYIIPFMPTKNAFFLFNMVILLHLSSYLSCTLFRDASMQSARNVWSVKASVEPQKKSFLIRQKVPPHISTSAYWFCIGICCRIRDQFFFCRYFSWLDSGSGSNKCGSKWVSSHYFQRLISQRLQISF